MKSNIIRQQMIYRFLSWAAQYTLLEIQDMLELEGIPISKERIKADLEEMSHFQKIEQTENAPHKYFIECDNYRDINDSIDYIINLNNSEGAFKVLDFLEDLRRQELRRLRFHIRTLIEQLLKFDHSIDKRFLLRAWYLEAINSSDSIKEMMEDSPSLIKLFNIKNEYKNAKERAAFDSGIDIKLFPLENPYDVFVVATNDNHLLFRYFEEMEKK